MEDVSVQPRAHLAMGRQWKSRSVLLLPNFSREKPAPVSPGPVIQHEGAVMQLSGKGLLVPGSWKRRYCVLDGRRLYYYHLNGENDKGHRHYRDKTSHYVDLDSYDICEEAKGMKTASNVLVVSSSEIEKSFFDTGRLYLSAETGKEMNEWISHIRSAMTDLRDGHKAQPLKNCKTPPSDNVSTGITELNNALGCHSLPQTVKASAAEAATSQASISLLSGGEQLDCMTKQRAKGPTGRRLPRQAKSRLRPADAVPPRSESLPRLQPPTAATDDPVHIRSSQPANGRGRFNQQPHNRSFDAGQPNKRAAAYAYSSSDDSLNMSLAQPAERPLMDQDDETVETLCEVALLHHHHATSTPSLVSHPSFAQWAGHRDWLNAGSSSSTPRPVATGQRRSKQPYSCGSTSADDPPAGLAHQHRLVLQQTAAIKTTLSGLEADFGASRRDMGWLQENLTTVQNAAGSVSDKVVKMQSQVATMERQINGAVKEAQQLQQRANEALKSASDAERDFRRLENDCQSLLNQLRHQQQQSSDSLADPLSPMTPHPPGSLMMHFQQPAGLSANEADGPPFSSQRSAATGRLPPLAAAPHLNIPSTFDFAALLTKSTAASSPVTELTSARIKSSFRSEGVNKNKSISFGPTTTYATSPTTSAADDVALPAATSTLKSQTRKKASRSGGPSFVLPSSDVNQHCPRSMTTS